MANLLFNLLLFTVAPKSTSPDILTLTIKDASATPHSALDVENPDLLHPQTTEVPVTSDAGVMRSESEPVSSKLTLGNLTVRVSSTNVSLAWSAPDEMFDTFLVEVRAPTGETQVHVTTLPGYVRKAEIEGLSPSTQYDITLQGLVDGKRSLPLKAFATTGTLSKYFFLLVSSTTSHSPMFTG